MNGASYSMDELPMFRSTYDSESMRYSVAGRSAQHSMGVKADVSPLRGGRAVLAGVGMIVPRIDRPEGRFTSYMFSFADQYVLDRTHRSYLGTTRDGNFDVRIDGKIDTFTVTLESRGELAESKFGFAAAQVNIRAAGGSLLNAGDLELEVEVIGQKILARAHIFLAEATSDAYHQFVSSL